MGDNKSNIMSYGLTALFITFIVALIIGVITAISYGLNHYRVWTSKMSGMAAFAEAEGNRQIKTLEAKAKKESASELAEAEIIRAEGVAKANKIIGDSLKGNEGYLRYLWIQSLEHSEGKVIYVPTEAGLPILEANRLNN
jgi:regulator of protease activity HflC (stomatin/prohibitin superfamily)